MRRSLLTLLSVAWLACALLPASAAAQSPWLVPRSDRAIYLEILKPSYDEAIGDYSFTSFAVFLSGRFAAGDNVVIVAELPFATVGGDVAFFLDGDGSDESESTVGNIYLGGEFGGTDSPTFGEFGVRLPLTMDADHFGFEFCLMDWVDRWEAFLHEIASVHAAFNYRYTAPSGFGIRGRFAPVLWFDTGDQLRDDVELFGLYSIQASYEAANVAVASGFSGRAHITEDYDDLGERTWHQLVLAASYGLGRWWPGVQIRLPLDEDLTDAIGPAFSLSLAVQLP